MITSMTGDIINTKALVLIHQVSNDGKENSMYFKHVSKLYPDINRSYKYRCRNGNAQDGDIQSLFFDDRARGGGYRIMVNCFFDNDDGQKVAIQKLYDHYKNDKIAIPMNGGDWNKGIIDKYLSDKGCAIEFWEEVN